MASLRPKNTAILNLEIRNTEGRKLQGSRDRVKIAFDRSVSCGFPWVLFLLCVSFALFLSEYYFVIIP